MKNTIEDKIPTQKEGGSSEVSSSVSCSNLKDAELVYEKVKQKLLNVNHWEKLAGISSADFQLCDSKGAPVERMAEVNDHFKIDIPGPGPVTGDGYDWVKVESIKETQSDAGEMIIITVRPATNPNNDRNDIAHFFSDTATSSFIVERRNNDVIATVAGRNENPNNEAEKDLDKARNVAVASIAITAFSKIQWKGLVDGLIKDD